jgi:hypothetical protein
MDNRVFIRVGDTSKDVGIYNSDGEEITSVSEVNVHLTPEIRDVSMTVVPFVKSPIATVKDQFIFPPVFDESVAMGFDMQVSEGEVFISPQYEEKIIEMLQDPLVRAAFKSMIKEIEDVEERKKELE